MTSTTTSTGRRRMVIVGGGIAGLAAAWEASSDGSVDVIVLEAADRVGGKIRTSTIGGTVGTTPIDEGPDNFLSRVPWAVDLCEELGLGDQLVEPAASRAGVWIDGGVVYMPGGTVLGVPFDFDQVQQSGILTPDGLARARSEADHDWSAPTDDVSIGGFLGERYGQEMVDRLVSPLVGGINAGNVHQLSLRAVTPQLWAAAIEGGSLSRTLARVAQSARTPSPTTRTGVFRGLLGGTETLVSALHTQLIERGVRITVNASVRSMERTGTGWRLDTSDGPVDADFVVLTTPVVTTADIVATVDPDTARSMRSIGSASVAMTTMVYAYGAFPDVDPTVSGILVPRGAGLATTAISFGSHKWPHWTGSTAATSPASSAAPDVESPVGSPVVLRVSAGHVDDPTSATLPENELIDRLTSEVTMLTGSTARPAATRVTRWVDAFPQYETGHLDLVDQIVSGLRSSAPNVRLAGASYRGLGIPACIESGRSVVRELLA